MASANDNTQQLFKLSSSLFFPATPATAQTTDATIWHVCAEATSSKPRKLRTRWDDTASAALVESCLQQGLPTRSRKEATKAWYEVTAAMTMWCQDRGYELVCNPKSLDTQLRRVCKRFEELNDTSSERSGVSEPFDEKLWIALKEYCGLKKDLGEEIDAEKEKKTKRLEENWLIQESMDVITPQSRQHDFASQSPALPSPERTSTDRLNSAPAKRRKKKSTSDLSASHYQVTLQFTVFLPIIIQCSLTSWSQ